MKNILMLTVILLASCSSQTENDPNAKYLGKAGNDKYAKKLDEDKAKIDSLKKIREKEIGSGNISDKKQSAISDSIIKLQIEYDSLYRESRK